MIEIQPKPTFRAAGTQRNAAGAAGTDRHAHTQAHGDHGPRAPSTSPQTVPGDYDRAEVAQLRDLRNRDREVRQHERAHTSAAAGVPHSAPSYTYKRGPDGRMYAVGGEVRLDTSAVAGDPHATLAKAQTIQQAALAPVDPSATDRAVAAQAAAMAQAARAEIQQRETEAPRRAGGADRASTYAEIDAEAGSGPGQAPLIDEQA